MPDSLIFIIALNVVLCFLFIIRSSLYHYLLVEYQRENIQTILCVMFLALSICHLKLLHANMANILRIFCLISSYVIDPPLPDGLYKLS